MNLSLDRGGGGLWQADDMGRCEIQCLRDSNARACLTKVESGFVIRHAQALTVVGCFGTAAQILDRRVLAHGSVPGSMAGEQCAASVSGSRATSPPPKNAKFIS